MAVALLVAGACGGESVSDADLEEPRENLASRDSLTTRSPASAASPERSRENLARGDSLTAASAAAEDEAGENVPSVGFLAVDPGDLFDCALLLDNTLACWGDGSDGQTDAPSGEFTALSTGSHQSCAIRLDGTVACWGSGESVTTPPPGAFRSVSVGRFEACGIRDDGGVVCWGELSGTPLEGGSYDYVEVGTGDTCAIRDDGRIRCADETHGPPPGGWFKQVSPGLEHSCAVRWDGKVKCWGSDHFGRASPPSGEFSSVVAQTAFSCGLRTDGEIACWGLEDDLDCGELLCLAGWGSRRLPDGPFVKIAGYPADEHWYFTWAYDPVCGVRSDGTFECLRQGDPMAGGPPSGEFRAVDSGNWSSCAVAVGGEVVCWGSEWAVPAGAFESVSVGDEHACGLRPGGEAECWGTDLYGETAPPEGPFVAVSAGMRLSCGLRPGGEAECWGYDGWWLHSPPPGPFTAVTAGNGSACALRPDGEPACWGRRRGGPYPEGRFEMFSLSEHACGLRRDGGVVCADKPDSWPDRHEYVIHEPEFAIFAPGAARDGPFTSFDGRHSHFCGLRADGTVDCWSSEDDWQAVSPAGRFTAIGVEAYEGCGIRPDRTLECWSVWYPPGWGTPDPGEASELPDTTATTTTTTEPEPADPPSRGVPDGMEWVLEAPPAGPFTTIDAGQYHTCGLRPDGDALCWGSDETTRAGPFAAISVGGRHGCYVAEFKEICSAVVCAVRPGGEPHCWLADPALGAPKAGALPPAGEPVRSLDVGFRTCAVRAAGGVNCTDASSGDSDYRWWWDHRSAVPSEGRFTRISVGYGWDWPAPYDPDAPWASTDIVLSDLLTGDTGGGADDDPGASTDVVVAGNSAAVGITADSHEHACALAAGGEIACWGSNEYGQAEEPPPWLGRAPYRDVAAGSRHTCALDRAGEAVCWGDNRHGQLDAPGGAFAQISAGEWHTCGLRPDGDVECWGDGTADYTGYIDEPPLGVSTDIPDGPFVEVSAGQWHTCGLRPDGEVACWFSY